MNTFNQTIFRCLFSLMILFSQTNSGFSIDTGVRDSTVSQKHDTSIVLNNGIYSLELKSSLINDTLKGEWQDNKFGTPLLKKQSLHFFRNGVEIKQHLPAIGYVTKEAINIKKVNLVAIPIFDICLLKGSDSIVYYVYGANFCNGMRCPEFTGLYNMNGDVLYENISTQKSLYKLEDVLRRYGLNINKPDTCQTILDIWKQH